MTLALLASSIQSLMYNSGQPYLSYGESNQISVNNVQIVVDNFGAQLNMVDFS